MSIPADLEEIFFAALARDTAAERAAFLEETCCDEPETRGEVERLLVAYARLDDFLEQPPAAVAAAAEKLRAPTPRVPELGFLLPPTRPESLGRLGHYEILEIVGSGGFGVVLRAFDDKLHRAVAIKTLSHSLVGSATARQRFVREARAAAAVNHDNVVHIYEVEEAAPVPYLVMEYVAGSSLDEKLRQNGPLPVNEVLLLGSQIAEGLAAAHAQGLVHRDIKPANILLVDEVRGQRRELRQDNRNCDALLDTRLSTADRRLPAAASPPPNPSVRVKITDFGLARAVDDASLSREGLIAGTPEFMSPEQASGQAVDHRTDLFSLGSVLYAMCTGRSPFAAEGSLAVLKRICEGTPQDVRELRPDVPGMLAELISQLHARHPDDRPHSADSVRTLLARCQDRMAKGSPALSLSRRRWMVAAGTAAAAVGLLCISRLRQRRHEQPQIGRAQNLPPVPTISQATIAANRRRWQPRVLLIIPPRDFYYPEYGPVRNALEAHGVEFRTASTTLDECLPNDISPQIPVTPDLLLADVRAADYDAVYFCGGEGALDYAEGGKYSAEAQRLIRDALAAECAVTAMGIAVVVLAEADVLEGRQAACNPHGKPPGIYVRRVKARGVHYMEDAVVEDGPFLTGRAPQYVQLFTKSLLKRLGIEALPTPAAAPSG